MEHYDVIMIGSGAGGGTVAHALAPTGKRVLLLERGDYLPREIENWSSKAVWGDGRYDNSGLWRDEATGEEFAPKQHYYVGGNTKFYGAVLFRMRERDFGEVQHVDGVSPAWPITYDDLEPYYGRAEELFHVHGERGADPTEPLASTPMPHPPISDEPRIAQLRSDLEAAGLHPFWLPTGIMLDERRPERSPCIRCATCDGFPCLVQRQGRRARRLRRAGPAAPNVELLTHAYVARLETSSDGRSVTGVVVERNGGTERYTRTSSCLPAGAINSAALLLRSANEHHPDGLANSSGVVGRNLMLHNNSR